MKAKAITPILTVSDLQQSFSWFDKLGWEKRWDWGDPPSFSAVGSGECEIFFCQDRQGGTAEATTLAHLGLVDMKRKTRLHGCQFGRRMWMLYTPRREKLESR